MNNGSPNFPGSEQTQACWPPVDVLCSLPIVKVGLSGFAQLKSHHKYCFWQYTLSVLDLLKQFVLKTLWLQLLQVINGLYFAQERAPPSVLYDLRRLRLKSDVVTSLCSYQICPEES